MNIIKQNELIYAAHYPLKTLDLEKENHTEWFGDPTESLQGSRMFYNKKTFRNHIHKLNPRHINFSQESFIIVRGKIGVDVWDETKIPLGTLIATDGDIIFVWRGYHELKILEDHTILYELKAGKYTSVEADKQFYGE